MRLRLALLVVLALALGGSAPARAHQSAVKDVGVAVDGATLSLRVRLAPGDVSAALGRPDLGPDDVQPRVAEVLAHAAAAGAEVQRWIVVRVDGALCAAAAPTLAPDQDPRFVVARWDARCPAPIANLQLDLHGFFAASRGHRAIVHLTAVDAPPWNGVVDADTPVVELPLRGERPGTALGWIRTGMAHIFEGPDHLAFVLALLIAVVLVRAPRTAARAWQRRPLVAMLRHTGALVTAFTVAHSLTLVAGALGVIAVPGVVVESLIAASIVAAAVENVARPNAPWRVAYVLTLGLVHGLGFASALGELLPPSGVVTPLLLFNVGVEVGQLCVVAIALPVLFGLARALGPARYRQVAIPALSVPLALLGLGWLVERVLGVAFMPC